MIALSYSRVAQLLGHRHLPDFSASCSTPELLCFRLWCVRQERGRAHRGQNLEEFQEETRRFGCVR